MEPNIDFLESPQKSNRHKGFLQNLTNSYRAIIVVEGDAIEFRIF